MTLEERSRLEELDRILRLEKVRAMIRPIIERVRADLAAKEKAVMAWEPVPLAIFGDALPAGIGSGWVFILRAGANTGAECHPNSHQRMMSFEGIGDIQTGSQSSDVGDQIAKPAISWRSNVLVSEPNAPLEQRWVSIPQNIWHQPVIANETDWVVVSFHTVPAEELIEERPADVADDGTKQMRYLESKRKD